MPTRTHSRRAFLKGAGTLISLPLLDAFAGRSLFASPSDRETAPMRMVCICSNMGVMPQFFWPKGSAPDSRDSEYLRILDDFRGDTTVFSGVSHPDVDGGHHAEVSYLTAAPHPSAAGFKNTISLDQYVAERIGTQTRLPYLTLNVGAENATLSWTASGVRVPAETSPAAVFKKLFVQGNKSETEEQVRKLRDGRSVLDAVANRAKRLEQNLTGTDREKVQQYFTSVRELEGRLVEAEAWEHKPKPTVDEVLPTDIDDRTELIGRTELMLRMVRLALETDSTRTVALCVDQNANPKVNLPGVSEGHHSLTHHGNREDSVTQLKTIESAQLETFANFLGSLKSTREDGGTLFDHTMVLYGSNLGNANSHDNRNLPMILAGGGFRHGSVLNFDRNHNEPLPNLFVTMLQRMGLEVDRFASSTGTLRELEVIS